MWHRRILVAAAFNGMAALGGRVLQAWGLNEGHRFIYLSLWFGTGGVIALVLMVRARTLPRVQDIAAGLAMGATSLAGEIGILRALQDLPGSVVYSGIIAGEIAAVGAVGAIVFGERIGPYGVAGIVTGLASVVLLVTR